MGVARLSSEDEPMLRGTAAFVADLELRPHTLHAAFVRSHEPHGNLLGCDVEAARSASGVVAVWRAEELSLPHFSYYPATTAGGAMARPLLAQDRVRFAGEPIAVVLADSDAAARDAAELVEVDIEPLPAVVDPAVAAGVEAPVVFEQAGTNVVVPLGEADGDDPLRGAELVAEVTSVSPRLTSAPIEPCGIVAGFEDGQLDVWCTGQGVHRPRETFAEVLGLDPAAVRVRHPVVGGGFGGRGDALIEFLVVAAVAQRLERPVRWIQDRAEQFVSMPYGRGQTHVIRLGVDAGGHIVGLDAEMWCDAGAYPHMAPVLAQASRRQCTGMYRIPAIRYRFGAAVTNLPPVGAYRGAGQPEVNLALERVIDAAARRRGEDPAAFRRRNLLRVDELPAATPTGIEIDSGDPIGALDAAVTHGVITPWYEQQRHRRQIGDRREIGIGIGCYSQTAGSGDGPDFAQLELDAAGIVHVSCASAGHGQGHHSLWTAMIEQQLGIGSGSVTVVDADSMVAPFGQVTGGSRTSFVLGSQVSAAAEQLARRCRDIAADLLEAHPDDLQPAAEGWSVAGVPSRVVPWADIAAAAGGSVQVSSDERIGGPTHPYGTHVSVVEVDLDTGGVRLLAHVAVDDCGVSLDEASVEGQQHGGAVSGIAAALVEAATWDRDGTPRTLSFGDYLLPTTAELPSIATVRPAIPTARNPLGARGIGENGAIAAPASVLNAAIDALAPHGVEQLQIPLTPESVWRALQA